MSGWMSWRRRNGGQPRGRHAAGRAAWAEPGLPPQPATAEPEPRLLAVQTSPATAEPEPQPRARQPLVSAGGAQPVAAQPNQRAVELGFADGSRLALAPGDPHALALRSVADVIARDLTASATR